MNISNFSTDGSNNNQNFQSFLQDYLSNLIQNSPPTEQIFSPTDRLYHSSSNQYINPIYRPRSQRLPMNMYIPTTNNISVDASGNATHLRSCVGISGNAVPRRRRNRIVDAEWGTFMESLLQNTISFNPQRNPAYLDRLLQNSLETTEKKFKMVLSKNGKEQIKHKPFTVDEFKDQRFCPISQKEFEEGDKVAQLPCNHIFEPDNILKWLEKENATCPICRFKLESVEKRKDAHKNNTLDADNNTTMGEYDDEDDLPALIPVTSSLLSSSQPDIQRIVNSLRFLNPLGTAPRHQTMVHDASSNRISTYNSRRRAIAAFTLLRHEETIQEEEDLQAALMASLETYDQEKKNLDETDSISDEEEIYSNDIDSEDTLEETSQINNQLD